MRIDTRLALTFGSVLCLGIFGSLTGLLASHWIGSGMQEMVADNVASLRAADELEIALLEQRGLVAAYLLDEGRAGWLGELARRRDGFEQWLDRARASARQPEERRILARLAEVYTEYDSVRDEVVEVYRAGDAAGATSLLLGPVNDLHGEAYDLCEELIAANERYIERRLAAGRSQSKRVTWLVTASVSLTIGGSLVLLILFLKGILIPLRRLAEEARQARGQETPPRLPGPEDELRVVGQHLRDLVSDVAETRERLARSRDHLASAEKLATVGALAASVAHEIRNPLTSIRMRLYSLRGGVAPGSGEEEDLQVIDGEVGRLEEIVRSFLEFSRPPEMRGRPEPAADLIDRTLDLVRPWLQGRGVEVEAGIPPDLPPVFVDGGQIRQVFLNLIRNAAEAMPDGGRLSVAAARSEALERGPGVLISFRDTGGGIPDTIRPRIFDPFFTTREDGTGIGLSIAARIVAQHGGLLELCPPAGHGTCFTVWLPAVTGDA